MTALNSRLMVTVAAFAAGAALALSGCSAGQISQTANQASAINGNFADVEEISLRNVHIVFPGEGYTNTQGGKALLALSVVNNSETTADELTSITTDLGQVEITPPAGKSRFEIGPQQIVVAAPAQTGASAAGEHGDGHGSTTTSPAPTTTAQPAADQDEAEHALIEITGLTKDITPGLAYTVSFNFKENGTVQVQVPVDAGTEAERHESPLSGPAPEGHGGGH
ncbi:hypothetical protein [Nocardia farcinica]|uniref:Lipoprotein lpqE n=1 Tax=Nocardia farcinica TaxID=37329 RepID=A0A449GMF5_NOCFR|nr:hypothetical protein [Nocardia farcinica]VFA93770.1 Uncharacterised protein [Nocardia farcinica]